MVHGCQYEWSFPVAKNSSPFQMELASMSTKLSPRAFIQICTEVIQIGAFILIYEDTLANVNACSSAEGL